MPGYDQNDIEEFVAEEANANDDLKSFVEARRRIPVLSHDRVIEVAGMPARPAGRAAE